MGSPAIGVRAPSRTWLAVALCAWGAAILGSWAWPVAYSFASGAVILYSPQRVPPNWGGITAGRGHSGDSLGVDAIASVLRGRCSGDG